MKYLEKEIIVLINKKTVEIHGGNFIPPFNFLNEQPLDYLIEAVGAEMYGEELYKSIHEKAGLYMFNIISNHVFQDGNKRTGLGSALIFLNLNGYELKSNLINENLIEFTLELASGKIELNKCQEWFKNNITPIKK